MHVMIALVPTGEFGNVTGMTAGTMIIMDDKRNAKPARLAEART
jgi:hypothetical protein